MARFFNNNLVELLAPAGNYSILEKIIDTGADAFYFGGKKHNMRMHRADFNFTDDEIIKAIDLIHSRGKKAYITVNNLMLENEIEDVRDYLRFLEKAGPDAIIVQDLGIVNIIDAEEINLEIHTSVMMNQHNSLSINELKSMGITRIVASRDMTLKDIHHLKSLTGVEFEYFTHGDMCVSHGAQCLYSSLVFGKSSNRGKCMKPCRWDFNIEFEGDAYNASFPLAVKDMYMYENIPELINYGITSFKIEGRMRTEDYLINIINMYSNSIDRYISDPLNFDRRKDSDYLFNNRKRDLSTGYAFGNPGLKYINQRYEGTGKFYSTGKVFSNPVKEFSKTEKRILYLKESLKVYNTPTPISEGKLSVRVNSKDHLSVCAEYMVDRIYINMNGFIPTNDIILDDLRKFSKDFPEIELFIALPPMSYESDHNIINHLAITCSDFIDGFLLTNFGQLQLLGKYDYKLVGDYSMNITNSKVIDMYKRYGLSMVTPSVELDPSSLINLLNKESELYELIVHGSPTVMYMEHNLFENISPCKGENDLGQVDISIKQVKTVNERPKTLYLLDEASGRHPVLVDSKSVNHMLLEKDICLIDIIDDLRDMGLTMFRIEGSHLSKDTLGDVIKAYKYVLGNKKYETYLESYEFVCNNDNFSLGALYFD